MAELATYPVPARIVTGSQSPISSLGAWRAEWMRARDDPDGFWLEQARELFWRKVPTRGLDGDYVDVKESPFSWFGDGILNVTESCLDRHLALRPDKTAILWEGDEPGTVRRISYRELHREVGRTANALRDLGIKKGERVVIYMGMVPEAAIAMLACARLGAVHSVVFGGFSAEALRDRIRDSGAEMVITQDEGRRGGRSIPLKAVTDAACEGEHYVQKVLVYRHTGGDIDWTPGRDVWWHDAVGAAAEVCEPVACAAEDPLFILYTSGSTGRPKGLVHTCGGYLAYAAYTHRVVFDLREDDVYACLADVGWITGHTYIVYGPLANGATTMMFESTPIYPDPGRYWDLVERHRISILYTAPTALRALAACSHATPPDRDRSSLRVLGTVGEPIDPDTWRWYYETVGEGRCSVVDTWWQTETGGILIAPIAPATPTRPGAATFPLPGVQPVVMTPEGRRLRGPGKGRLCIEQPWPGQARTVWGDHDRYFSTYFSTYPGLYFTGDGCRRDEDGYYWITGRVDDVLNVAGHRLGTAEFESALIAVEEVAEAAVVGYPHPSKGQGVCAFIVTQPGVEVTDGLRRVLQKQIRTAIGAIAHVDVFHFVPGLPKTRSGKIMRRILRRIAEGQPEALGDISTLADAEVVQAIIAVALDTPVLHQPQL